MATGSAPSAWIQHARSASGMLPAGVSDVDLSQMRNLDERDEQLWETYVARLRVEPGIAITAIGERDAAADASGPGQRKWLISRPARSARASTRSYCCVSYRSTRPAW